MSGLVFLGDTVWPAPDCMDIEAIIGGLHGKQLVVNLEGPILERSPSESKVNNRFKTNLHSDPQMLQVLKRLNVVACDLANNHINDYVGSVSPTIRQLTGSGIDYFGTVDRNHTEIIAGNTRYILIGACSELPECKSFPGDANPNLFRPRTMLTQIASLKTAHPDARVVCVVHWGYELSGFPEPADREWAHRAIEAGADYVIGHHPHVVQGVEQLEHGFIAYSLGNFLMPQGLFNGTRLQFFAPEVLTQLGVELSADAVRFHWFQYDKEKASLAPVIAGNGFDEQAMLRKLSPFAGMTHAQYRRWFASEGIKGHFAKRRGGPIYRGYFGLHGIAASVNDWYMLCKRRLRKELIRVGLHRPYNW
ncbi:MAG: CapA family protein [Nitrosomonas sp.]|nr:MAG: CapA family protein [Nitrosomonas sp.]